MLNTKLLGSVSSPPLPKVQDVFSTYLTTGASANITVVNGIDLAGKGGLVWQKTRNTAGSHTLFDTVRGVNNYLFSNSTSAQGSSSNILPTFNNDGFVIGTDNNLTTSGTTGVNWTFRKEPKFSDVITYTGNGSSTQVINHNLGSTPGMIIIKKTSTTSRWNVYHRSLTAGSFLKLHLTDAQEADSFMNGANVPTSTTFTAQAATSDGLNANGATYVAYLFAHNAGGFGTAGTDNIISCGSFTTDGNGDATVNLGYEPQWIIYKESSSAGENWSILDTMRGFDASANQRGLNPNTSGTENNESISARPTSTGFTFGTGWYASRTFIYMTIRKNQ